MARSNLHFLTISEASELIASRQLSPVDLVDAHLRRIEATDARLNSFITLLEGESRAAAKRAEAEIGAGAYRGPLHGIPFGLKDLYYTKGVRTTIGSTIMGDFVPDEDATVTRRFSDAGAILLGKLQMHEFALGATSENPHYGPAHNPWDTDRVTGGSSGGSGSSVSSGQCMAALGTDTGGSIRMPASFCGIVGLKPTFGRVSRYGVYPLSWSFDTVGPMARTVRDTALVMNAIAGRDPLDPFSSKRSAPDFTATLGQDLSGTRIGVPREHFFDILDPEVEAAVNAAAAALEGLGASVDEVSIPMLPQSLDIGQSISTAEAGELHLDNLRHRGEEMDQEVRARLETGALMPAVQYIRGQRARRLFNQQVAEAMRNVDVLLTATTPVTAPKIGQRESKVAGTVQPTLTFLARLTRPHNVSGVPVITLPCGFSSEGIPIGLQLAGRPFDEATVLKVAHAYEQATDWHLRRPPL